MKVYLFFILLMISGNLIADSQDLLTKQEQKEVSHFIDSNKFLPLNERINLIKQDNTISTPAKIVITANILNEIK